MEIHIAILNTKMRIFIIKIAKKTCVDKIFMYICYLKKIHNKYLNYSTLLTYQTRKNSLQCPLFKLQNRVNPPKKTSTRILTF